ncbi:D-aminoacyl-tRNA deacylase [Rhodohalobacter mucosus]|uniref:D-aminoacyl-tRNA deacylase n=1 Tax=Rhodohalobacter mucosus TaxID=2079485 RepID=A0A316TSL3_9BACT|nr:D-aminoacyl-tRNA deacylase [Rhodohalobacter mucosus]PWN05955.1 D-tyrosyl-tRNA(Tyr) deacylase [Rhodohalobacter mucosus]
MKIVVQRVKRASVTVNGEIIGKIGHGLLLLAGIHADDTDEQLEWCCNKIMKLRIFNDQEGLMNRSVQDVNGEILVVSQFTLYGDTRKGTRPGFTDAAPPEAAEPIYERMIEIFRQRTDLNVESGVFGAMMDVELVNDGPVTLIIKKEAQ